MRDFKKQMKKVQSKPVFKESDLLLYCYKFVSGCKILEESDCTLESGKYSPALVSASSGKRLTIARFKLPYYETLAGDPHFPLDELNTLMMDDKFSKSKKGKQIVQEALAIFRQLFPLARDHYYQELKETLARGKDIAERIAALSPEEMQEKINALPPEQLRKFLEYAQWFLSASFPSYESGSGPKQMWQYIAVLVPGCWSSCIKKLCGSFDEADDALDLGYGPHKGEEAFFAQDIKDTLYKISRAMKGALGKIKDFIKDKESE